MRLLAASQASGQLYVDDVFSTYLYTGNGTTQTITNGIDLAGEGGMVWLKNRTAASQNRLFDTERGVGKMISSDSTAAEVTESTNLTSFNSDGFSTGGYMGVYDIVSWTFRKAPRFFDLAEVTKSSGSDATASFPDLETLGMVVVKRTDSTGSWYVWHRSLTAGKLLYLEQTAAEATLGHITVSGTTVTLENGVIADGSYVVYAWAHDTEDDGIIQCGSYTGNGNYPNNINLGWEAQWVLVKAASIAGEQWYIVDSMRGAPTGEYAVTNVLYPNTSDAEYVGRSFIEFASSGFSLKQRNEVNQSGATYIYIAIRRPNKPPTSGSEVFSIDTGTGSDPAYVSDFPVDFAIHKDKDTVVSYRASARLTGANYMKTDATDAEAADTNAVFDNMTGWNDNTALGSDDISWMLRRAPGFFDVVCYTGDGVAGMTVNHNLGAVPEMMIVKDRTATRSWIVYCAHNTEDPATDYLMLQSTSQTLDSDTPWNDTEPTNSLFFLGTALATNAVGENYIAYLFASLPGISKVGSYTGNGTSQTIDCGFSTGARFILIKRTDDTGDWYIWDTERGIVAGDDPHLSLNTTAAEVTTDDSIDPDTSGFVVNQVAATNINVSSAEYIFLAIS